eukprot:Hpha_TRINITY_DN15933_c2_g3::TRINITY_DN15933_c2_g3_i1::g.72926::m.72926
MPPLTKPRAGREPMIELGTVAEAASYEGDALEGVLYEVAGRLKDDVAAGRRGVTGVRRAAEALAALSRRRRQRGGEALSPGVRVHNAGGTVARVERSGTVVVRASDGKQHALPLRRVALVRYTKEHQLGSALLRAVCAGVGSLHDVGLLPDVPGAYSRVQGHGAVLRVTRGVKPGRATTAAVVWVTRMGLKGALRPELWKPWAVEVMLRAVDGHEESHD